MKVAKEKWMIIIAGLVIGVIASALVLLGNPKNMGFCIACFIRDTAGALGLHGAKGVMYLRPETPRRQLADDAAGSRFLRHDRLPDVPRLPLPHDSPSGGR